MNQQRSFLSFLLRVGPAALYAAVIFYLGTVPHVAGAPSWPGIDKVFHAVGFFVMACLVAPAIRITWPNLRRQGRLRAAAVVATALGGLLEVVQIYCPPRTAEILDLVADALGAALAMTIWGALEARNSQRSGVSSRSDESLP